MSFLVILQFFRKYWKLGVAGIFVLAIIILGWYAYIQHNKAENLSIKYQQSLTTIAQQSHAIDTFKNLNQLIDQQNQDRKKLENKIQKQSEETLSKLNELKQQNKEYARCSNAELPYRIDSMFNDTSSE